MARIPDSIVNYFDHSPGGTFAGYLADLMADPSSTVEVTESLRGKPAPIVPIHQITSGINLAPGRLSGNEVLQISDSTVLKVGCSATMSEVEALILVSSKTSVPVPKVFSAYTIGHIGFILMSKIEGESLGVCWNRLSHDDLEFIVQQLKSYVSQWRTLRSSFLGSVTGGPCDEIIFRHIWDPDAFPKPYGPFYSLDEYKHAVIKALRRSRPEGLWRETEEKLKEKILAFEMESHSELGVLTHGDIHAGNIMIHNGSVSGILDWGEAGYSLPEREFFAARRMAIDEDWIEIIPRFIPLFPREYALWDEVDRSMRLYSPI